MSPRPPLDGIRDGRISVAAAAARETAAAAAAEAPWTAAGAHVAAGHHGLPPVPPTPVLTPFVLQPFVLPQLAGSRSRLAMVSAKHKVEKSLV